MKTTTLLKRQSIIKEALRKGLNVFADIRINNEIRFGLVVRDVRKQTHEIQVLVLEGWHYPIKVFYAK